MKVDFEGAVGRAWRYATDGKRLATLSISFIIAFSLIIFPLISLVQSAVSGGLAGIAGSALVLILGFVVGILILLYVSLLFTNNYANQKSLSKSNDFAKSRFLRFLAAAIITGFIGGIVSLVPFLGILFAIIVGIVFFFVHQVIAVSDKRLSNALSTSYELAKNNVVSVIITFIISIVLAIVIIIIAAIPFLAAFFSSIISSTKLGLFSAMTGNLALFAVTGIILAVGFALAALLTIGIKTDVYMQIAKRKRSR